MRCLWGFKYFICEDHVDLIRDIKFIKDELRFKDIQIIQKKSEKQKFEL